MMVSWMESQHHQRDLSPVRRDFYRESEIDCLAPWKPVSQKIKLTGARTRNANNVEPAEKMKTALRLISYESLACFWSIGGRVATICEECRIFLTSCTESITLYVRSELPVGTYFFSIWPCDPTPKLDIQVRLKDSWCYGDATNLTYWVLWIWFSSQTWIQTYAAEQLSKSSSHCHLRLCIGQYLAQTKFAMLAYLEDESKVQLIKGFMNGRIGHRDTIWPTEHRLKNNSIAESEGRLVIVSGASRRKRNLRTMPIQVKNAGESRRKDATRDAPMKGNHPNVKLMVLYLPVRCIT